MKSFWRSVVLYIIISYGFTWIFIFTALKLYGDNSMAINFLHAFGALGPAIGAVVVSRISRDPISGERIRLTKIPNLFIWVVLSPLILFALGVFISAISKGEWPDFNKYISGITTDNRTFFIWFLPLITYAVFEEIGWRGYLLPHLQSRFTALKSTFILIPIWAIWHFPFFFYRFDFSLGISIGFFFGLSVGALILTAIFNNSRGSVLWCMAFHFLNNLCSDMDKEFIAAVLSVGFVFIAVALVWKKKV